MGGCARGGWEEGPCGAREAGERPGTERPATSVTGREPIPRSAEPAGPALCREEASGRRRPFFPCARSSAPTTCLCPPGSPDPPETEGTEGYRQGRPASVCLEAWCIRYREFRSRLRRITKSWEIASVLVSIGSAPRLALQPTMKNQDKKNGAAKQSGHNSNPKSNPGQVEAGPAGAQGLPSRAASAAPAEGSARQTPGKTEGVCQPCFPCGPGEELAVRRSSFWR